MLTKKMLKLVTLVIVALTILTGCSQSQQDILSASLKLQDANSLQEHTTMSIQVNGTGFDSAAQQQIDKTAMFLNNAKLDLDVKMKGNEQKTLLKSQMDINLATQGMSFDMPLWVNSDLTGSTPKLTEIIQLPQIAKANLPAKFLNKDYMVINPADISNPAFGGFDTTSLMNNNKFKESEMNFLNYIQRFNPNINISDNGIQNVQTADGVVSARIYELKLTDSQFKDLISYTVNNFVQDDTAMNSIKQLIDTALNQSSDKTTLNAFDKSFQQFSGNKTQFLSQFNTFMDRLNSVTLLGSKGIDIQYAISNGYVVQENGTIDLNIDVAQLNQLFSSMTGNQTQTNDVKGVLDIILTYKTDISGINNQPDIQIPEVNSDNSFNFTDLVNKPNQ